MIWGGDAMIEPVGRSTSPAYPQALATLPAVLRARLAVELMIQIRHEAVFEQQLADPLGVFLAAFGQRPIVIRHARIVPTGLGVAEN